MAEVLTRFDIEKNDYDSKVAATAELVFSLAALPGARADKIGDDGLNHFIAPTRGSFGFAGNNARGTMQVLRYILLTRGSEAYGIIDAYLASGAHSAEGTRRTVVSRFAYDTPRATIAGFADPGTTLDIHPSDDNEDFAPKFAGWQTTLTTSRAGRMHLEHGGKGKTMIVTPVGNGVQLPALPPELWAPPSEIIAPMLGGIVVGAASVQQDYPPSRLG